MFPANAITDHSRLRIAQVLRTLGLAGLLLSAAAVDVLTSNLLATIVLWMVFGLLATWILGARTSTRFPIMAIAIVEDLLAVVTLAQSGWWEGPLWWSLLIPSMAASLLLPWSWVVGMAILVVGVAAAGAVLQPARADIDAVGLTGRSLGILAGTAALSGLLRGLYPILERLGLNGSSTLRAVRTQERARTNWLFQAAAEINASLNVDEVIEHALDLCGQALAGEDGREAHLCSALILLTDQGFQPVATRRMKLGEMNLGFSVENGALSRALVRGDAQMIFHPDLDPELTQVAGLKDCQEVLIAPLAYGFETYGILLFGHPESGFFSHEKRELLVAIAKQITIALQNAHLYQDLEGEKERITELQEDARKKLARNLHDGPTQTMAAITMRINFARRLMDRDPEEAAVELGRVEDMARHTTREIRHMLFTLRPLILETQGLVIALYQLSEKVRETHNQQVFVDADPALVEGMDLGRQGVLFYIAEEAINNARKHAMAENIWVRLRRDRENVLLEVEDDGVGFNIGAVDAHYEQRGSLGIVSMRERADLVAGSLQIESAEGRGTRVTLYVPFGPKTADTNPIDAPVGRDLDA